MSAEMPVWILIAPLVLLLMLAGAGFGGFLLLKSLRAQPQATGVVTGLTLLGFGFLGFVMLSTFGLLIAWLVGGVSHDQRVAHTPPTPPVQIHIDESSRVREIQQRLDSALEAQGIGHQPDSFSLFPRHQVPHRIEQASAPARAKILVIFLFVAACVAAFVLTWIFSSQNRMSLGAGAAAVAGVLLIVGLYFVRSSQVVHESATAVIEEIVRDESYASAAALKRPVDATSVAVAAPEPNDFVPVAPVEAVTPVPADPALPATDYRSSVVNAVNAAPDWVRGGVQRRGDVTMLVCSSKQFATEAEADVDARAAVRDYLLDEQRRNTGAEPFRLRATPSVDGQVASVIKDRYVETVQRDFGSMFATMYRVWLKAEITPATQAQLRAAHLANVQEGRMVVAGTGLGALLCIPLGIVTYGKLNRRLNHRFSRTLKAGVAAGVLALWSLGLLLLERTVTLF